MKDGFIKAAAGTIDVVVADVQYNTEQILARMREGLHVRRSVFL